MTHHVYIALGSNQGDRLENLQAAVAALPPEVQIEKRSRIYETEPWGYTDQPDFLNQVVAGETALDPRRVLTHLKAIEDDLGRQETFRYGPRVIDLDLLFYDDLVSQAPDLAVPHPRLHERAFVLVPLADIAPSLRHPVSRKTVQEMLRGVDVAGIRPYPDSDAPGRESDHPG